MDHKSLIDPNNFISKSYLESLSQAVNVAKKTMESFANSSALQIFIKDQSKIQDMVQSVAKSFEPAFESMKAQQELIKSIKSWDLYSTYTPRLTSPMPQREIITANKAEEKSFTKKEMEEVVKLAIAETLEKIKNQEININTVRKFPSKLPQNILWTDIVIKFKDGYNVEIVAGEAICIANYKEMGFEDSRKLAPNTLWTLLKTLSEIGGGVSWKDNQAGTLIKKKKQLLSKGLKEYFGIKDDPFHRYSKKDGYQLKIRLVPVSESINNYLSGNKSYNEDGDDDNLGIKESLNDFSNRI